MIVSGMNKNVGFISLLSCGLMLACFGLLVRILNQYIGVLTQAGGRMLVATLIVLLYLFSKKISFKFKVDNKILFTTFILSFPLYIIFFTLSLTHIKAANAFFYLFASTMLTSFIIGKAYFKENLHVSNLVAAVFLIAGLLFLSYPFNFKDGWIGILSGIIGGILYGISNATRKHYAAKINLWLAMLYQILAGTLISFTLSYFFKEYLINNLTITPLFYLFIFGLGLTLIQLLLFAGFKNFPLNLGSIVLASQLLFIEIVGIFFLKEIPTLMEMAGSAAILIAVFVSNYRFKSLNLLTSRPN